MEILLERYADPAEVFKVPVGELTTAPGIGPKTAEAIRAGSREDAARERERAREIGAAIITRGDAAYPRNLLSTFDPPGVLYVMGELVEADALALAIVGSRRASFYGRKMASKLARQAAGLGITIVSGLARGIDSAAHEGALEVEGRTIAVCGSGLATVYPPENEALFGRIGRRGCGALVSEFPVDYPVRSENFPRRNRLISGLALGVVVVEAAKRSGSLITARHAAEQGREVFAVPGPADKATSRGCHRLIKDGAKLTEDIDDVIEEMGPLAEKVRGPRGEEVSAPRELKLNDREQALYACLGSQPVEIDDLAEAAGVPVHQAASTLMVLEVRKLARELPGKRYVRT
jgi:DNA processing protein